MTRWVVGVVLSLVLVACGGGRFRAGTFDTRGYRHPYVEYRIAGLGGGALLGDSWMLDNYRDARFLRETAPYTVTRRYDVDGDGDIESLGLRPLDDLRYRSTRDAGSIWVRTLPVPSALATTEMSVLMRLLVDGVASTGTVAAAVDREVAIATSRTYTASILEAQSTAVDGREAYAATIDVANVAQLQLDPTARTERVRLVLVRTDFRVPLYPDDFDAGIAPGLLVLGYSNLPAEFDRSLPEFEDLVRRVVFETEEARVGAGFTACESPDGITSFALERPGVRTYVILRPEDGEDRECIERLLGVAGLEANRSYGFRPGPLRFSSIPVEQTPAPVPPPAPADSPAPEPVPSQ